MNPKKTYRVLCFFDYLATTGFGTVSHNIMTRLETALPNIYWDIVAINYFGEPFKTQKKNVIGQSADKNGDRYIRNEFLNMLKTFDYDLVFMINDLGVVCPMIEVMEAIKKEKKQRNKKMFKTIFYFPVDAPKLHREFKDLSFFDILVPYTQFAKKEVAAVMPELKTRMQVILHGVNTLDFMEVGADERGQFREAYFGKENADRYIIGNINRNQPRKDIPTTIFAFACYKENNDPNALLYLHMHPKDEMGYDLRRICDQMNLVENKDYLFPPPELIEKQPEPKYLCMIYNALDIFVTTTTGEGFGLTVLEAMQCGVPVVAPWHTSLKELENGEKNFRSVYTEYLMASHFDNTVRYQVDYEDVADAIDFVRSYEDDRLRMVDNAKKYAAALSWDIVINKWIELFKQNL